MQIINGILLVETNAGLKGVKGKDSNMFHLSYSSLDIRLYCMCSSTLIREYNIKMIMIAKFKMLFHVTMSTVARYKFMRGDGK